MFLKISYVSPGNTCVGASLTKVAGPKARPVTLLKSDSNIGVFQWNRKFLRTPPLAASDPILVQTANQLIQFTMT